MLPPGIVPLASVLRKPSCSSQPLRGFRRGFRGVGKGADNKAPGTPTTPPNEEQLTNKPCFMGIRH